MIAHVPPLIVSHGRMFLPHEALAHGIRRGVCVECRGRAHLVAEGVPAPLFSHSPTDLHTAALAREPETGAHRETRIRLTEVLQEMIRDGDPLWIGYRCPTCGRGRTKNALAEVSAAVTGRTLELPQGRVNPDVALIKRMHLVAAIEVVVSHPVSVDKMAIFKNARVMVIETGAHAILSRRPEHPWIASEGRYQADLRRRAVAAGKLCRIHWYPASCRSKRRRCGFRLDVVLHMVVRDA